MSQDPDIPAGWYPDPTGAPRNRWWNGVGWAEATSEATTPMLALPASPTAAPSAAPSFLESMGIRRAPGWYPDETAPGQQRWWDGNAFTGQVSGTPYAAMAAAPGQAPIGASPYNRHIWAIVGIYGAISILGPIYIYAMLSNPAVLLGSGAELILPQLGLGAVGLAAWIVVGVLAYSDYKDLASRGVLNPFHWGMVFIPSYGPTIYIIGRSVVVRRRTGSGMRPMWWHLALYVASGVFSVVAVVAALSTLYGYGSVY